MESPLGGGEGYRKEGKAGGGTAGQIEDKLEIKRPKEDDVLFGLERDLSQYQKNFHAVNS